MAEKKIQARIRQKVDTKVNWDKATNFVPLKGEYIYYSDLHKVKVGDGVTKVSALPFLADQPIKTLNTNNTAPQTPSSNEAIAGSGTINLHKVAKTGSYNDLNDKPNVVKYTNHTVEVAGTNKTVAAVSPSALYVANGLIMGGTSAAAGLVTRGICGVTTPDNSTGACTKENLYLNYDGDSNYLRKVVLGAGNAGDSIAGGATTFSAVRGDQMVGYVNSLALIKSGKQTTTSTDDGGSNVYTFTDTKGATSTFTVKNGSKGSTGSVASITYSGTGNYVKDISLNTSTKVLTATKGTLAAVATSGSYNDLSNKPTNFLDKGTSSTNNNQVVYNPVEMKKALTVPSVQGTPIQTGPSESAPAFSLGSTTINGTTAAQLLLSSPGLGSTTITQNSAVFKIEASKTLSCDPEGWKIGNRPIIHAGNIDSYIQVSTQQWKLTSTTGTVTTINICTK